MVNDKKNLVGIDLKELEKYRQIHREMRWHENELIDHRISWMLTFHSLLIAAVAFAWQDKANHSTYLLLIGFSIAGILVSISGGLSISIAHKAGLEHDKWWLLYGTSNIKGAPPIYGYEIKNGWEWKVKFLFPEYFFPLFFEAFWIVLILYEIYMIP
jgi:hypothetical protein